MPSDPNTADALLSIIANAVAAAVADSVDESDRPIVGKRGRRRAQIAAHAVVDALAGEGWRIVRYDH